jgi:heme exporter protein A
VINGHGLAKRYGDRRVFRNVDVELAGGGFLLVTGPNGSGKTTLLRILAGELTPLENLTLFGRLYRLPERGERIGMLLERFNLWDVRHDRVSTFSRGMRQRLGLCRVLLHAPQLLLLDEPYNALDSEGAELLDAILDEPRTLVVATHEPQRVERRATQRLAFG